MKSFRTIAALAFSLFIIGFFSSSILTDLTEVMLERKFLSIDPWDAITPKVSLGLLLALCSVSAYALTWAYTKVRTVHFSKLVFIFGLLISIAIAGISIWLRLLQVKSILNFGNVLNPDISLSAGALNYFGWGFWPVFWIYGMAILVLLWSSRKRKKRELG